eukprot:jgi/Galph1/3725/GphlegSOOS_G2429.1
MTHGLANHPPETLGFHGWRWHSISILYELGCLKKSSITLATQCLDCVNNCLPNDAICLTNCRKVCEQGKEKTSSAFHHVWNWNWKNFHRVEEKILFPLLYSKLLTKEGRNILHRLEKQRDKIQRLATFQWNPSTSKLTYWERIACFIQKTTVASFKPFSFYFKSVSNHFVTHNNKSFTPDTKQLKRYLIGEYEQQQRLNHRINLLYEHCEDYFTEISTLYPVILPLFSQREQKQFNRRVLRFLGFRNNRLHLVAFDEALRNTNIGEWKFFRSQIPAPIKMILPYWKRKYYQSLHKVICLSSH